jgi:LysM repeat protein
VISHNGLASADALQLGEGLRIPAAARPSGSDTTAVASRTATTYVVKTGDTLFAIAEKAGVAEAQRGSWMEQVVALNGLSGPDALRMGETLRLPGISGGNARTEGPAAQATGSTAYVVKPGDTLYGIASQRGVSEGELVAWFSRVLQLNGMTSPDSLSVGADLRLPAATGASPQPRPASEPLVSYTVRPGDTLSSIADDSGVPAQDVAAWIRRVIEANDLDGPDLLRVGAALRVPAPRSSVPASRASTLTTTSYAVKPGDTLSEIARRSGISETELAAWLNHVIELNSLPGAESLRAGATLQVPVAAEPAASTPAPSATAAPAQAPAASALGGWSATETLTYVVQAGESLDSIARKHGVAAAQISAWIDRVAQLSRINRNDALLAGEVLLIPAPQAAPVAAVAVQSPAAAPKPAVSRIKYKVKPGDSLFDIAVAHGVSERRQPGWVADVLDLNSLASADMIIAGKELLLPEDTPSPASTPAPAPAAASAPAAAPAVNSAASAPGLLRGPNGSCFYTVQTADTWDGIAQKLGVAAERRAAWIASIRDLNGLVNSPPPVGDGLRMLC